MKLGQGGFPTEISMQLSFNERVGHQVSLSVLGSGDNQILSNRQHDLVYKK